MNSIIRYALYSDNIKKMASHYHDCHQILFIKSGRIEIEINGKIQTASSGDIIIISRFENHSIKILSEKYERYIIRIDPQIADVKKDFSILTLRPQSFQNIIHSNKYFDDFINIFERIIKEFKINDISSQKINELLVSELLIYAERLLPNNSAEYNDSHFEIVFNLQRKFENEYSEQFNLKNLAEQYHISISNLCHSFKKITGSSVMDYLISCRMANAKRLLTKTNLSISEIVELCGFSDNSNFSRTFKKLNNISPSEFRIKFSDKNSGTDKKSKNS